MTDAQAAQVIALLTEIRDGIAYLCAEPEPVEDQAPACPHDEHRRIDYSTPRETHWVCQDCGHVERRRGFNRALADGAGASAEE